jgi:hypothetical protein
MVSEVQTHQLTPLERARLRGLFWVLVAICILSGGVGWYLIQWQSRPLENSVQVPATVRRVDVLTQTDSKGHATKHPLLLYSYSVGGVVYTTDRIVPSSDQRDGPAALALASSLRDSQVITAYYDSTQPSSAYLIREHTRLLYVYCVLPLLLAVVLIANWPRVARA